MKSAALGLSLLLVLPASGFAEDKGQAQLALLKQEWARDPFVVPEKKENSKEQGPLKLTGIFVRAGKKIAIINHSFMKEGEAIQGYTIMRIEGNQVLLNGNQQEFYLRISENEKPKPKPAV